MRVESMQRNKTQADTAHIAHDCYICLMINMKTLKCKM